MVEGTTTAVSEAYAFTHRVMVWHIATRYCELADHQEEQGGGDSSREKNRRVATVLSKYCAYLVAFAPELLPGPAAQTTRAHPSFMADLIGCYKQQNQKRAATGVV
jgi:hypothetical protein